MSATLERLTAREQERKAALQEEWRAAVREIGDGADLDPDAVERLLTEIGKTPADLRAAVSLHQRRAALAATAETRAAWAAEVRRVRDAQKVEALKFEQLQREYVARMQRLQQEEFNACQGERAAIDAADELKRTPAVRL